MARSKAWTLTFRHGPRVERHQFEQLDDAIAALSHHLEQVRAEGPLGSAKMFREYEPGQRVQARGELSRGGILKSVSAGIDLMGDGTLVPFQGSVRRRLLEVEEGASPFDALRHALQPAG